ncbi:uncharacterized protein [Drosophila takahashii]|uniref:uncharacterized protein isoform X2 n=1 Tax=Drosophila takahashii TaxID=29030 RepID=UPI003898DDC8
MRCPKLDKERVRRRFGGFWRSRQNLVAVKGISCSPWKPGNTYKAEEPRTPNPEPRTPGMSRVTANWGPKSEQKLRRRRTQGICHSSKFTVIRRMTYYR